MTRIRGLSPKIIGPVTAALSAFVVAKVHDDATAALIVALIGAVGLYAAPAGTVEATDDVDVDDHEFDDTDDLFEIAGEDPDAIERPQSGQVPAAPKDDE